MWSLGKFRKIKRIKTDEIFVKFYTAISGERIYFMRST
jgi:hypothetical protein